MLLSNFNKTKNKKESKVKGGLQIVSGASLLGEGYRRGLPRALGVRLESHSTSRKKAKEILKKGGYLDLERMGDVTGVAQGKDVYGGKKYGFITGHVPDAELPLGIGKGTDRMMASSIRKSYRAMASMNKNKVDDLLRSNLVESLKKGIYVHSMNEGQRKRILDQVNTMFDLDLKSVKKLKDKDVIKDIENRFNRTRKTKIPIVDLKKELNFKMLNPMVGRSLYVGGSDEFFKKNFTPAEAMLGVAMKSDKPFKLKGSRLGAVQEAIKREGLGNLIKANPKRVRTGLGIIAGTGLLGGALIKSGLKKIKGKEERKYTKKDTNYWANLKARR